MTDDSAASEAEPLTHTRAAVERWLAWSGLLPLPLLLLLHLAHELRLAFATDVSEVLRPAAGVLARLAALLLIGSPLLLHVGLGSWLLLDRRGRSQVVGDVDRLPRFVSRVAAVASLVFIIYHVRTFSLAVWLGEADPRDAGFRLVAELSSTIHGIPLVGAAYLLGLLATATHCGLSVHRAVLVQGWLPTQAKRRRSARCCAAFSALLFCLGAAAVIRVAGGALLG